MNLLQQRVRDFHIGARLPVTSQPHYLSSEMRERRIALIREETAEVIKALSKTDRSSDNFNQQVHELMDLLVVTIGTLVEMGVEMEEPFNLIMDANFRKLQPYCVREDGKILKPLNWEPAQITCLPETHIKRKW